jgi:hypothetical protein
MFAITLHSNGGEDTMGEKKSPEKRKLGRDTMRC